MPEKEIIAHLGVEGGGASIYRTALPSGAWQFHVEQRFMDMDENDDEFWHYATLGPFASIQETVEAITRGFSLALYHPSKVHPEYRQCLLTIAQAAGPQLPEHMRPWWESHRESWRRACQDEEQAL